ncbi:MAG: FG-GAP repeat protein, partial [Candidatus Peregrinibacteria bacterium GW2011_GWA2_44_7]
MDTSSHSSLKENFQDIPVLNAISQLRINSWKYKPQFANGDLSTHLYPTTDEFYAAFGLGRGEFTISPEDIAGVALKGVQELNSLVTLNTTKLSAITNKLQLDGTNFVGIGTTSPQYALDVDHPTSKINSKNGYLTNGADYAEYFETKDEGLVAGEVVCIDTINSNSVSRCKNASDINVMGIVSTNPAFLGNASFDKEGNPKYKAIAMLGQIPGKVSNENGAIQIGDSLTSASIPGYIMKANAGDSTVGVALESFGDSNSKLEISNLKSILNDLMSKNLNNENSELIENLKVKIKNLEMKGTIQVMISRKNKSITVESVEAKVTERIAAMKIEDEVNRLVTGAVQALTPLNVLTLDENGSIITSTGSTGYNLSDM